jgi:hypothetical protein
MEQPIFCFFAGEGASIWLLVSLFKGLVLLNISAIAVLNRGAFERIIFIMAVLVPSLKA